LICYICDKEDWHSFDSKDQKLNPARELLCCKGCGSVCYRVEPASEEKIRDYYRKEYRPEPNHLNLITTTHKLNYIKIFLQDYFKGKEPGLVIGDVGSATGYLVAHFRGMGHKATGCEYTVTYRRFAEHFYGVPLTEELRTDLKYDLITVYHVLEHLIEPDKKLAHYVSLLKDDGRMLISTPQWYDVLEEASGPNVTTFEHLWHKDHINVFSETTIRNLFTKCELVIEKEDHFVYGQTYLLRKMTAEEKMHKNIVNEGWEEKVKRTLEAKLAIELFGRRDLREALKVWPKFPDAWLRLAFEVFGKDPDRQADLFEEAEKLMPIQRRLLSAKAVWLFQRQKYDEAMKIFEWFAKYCPDEDKLMFMGFACALNGDGKRAMPYFYQAADMDPRKWSDAMDWVCREAAKLPTWDERALETISRQVKETARPGLKLVDPMFDKAPDGYGSGQELGNSREGAENVPDETRLADPKAGIS